MLVLTRKLGEKVVIGGNITLTVVEIRGSQVRLAFDAPTHVRILRGELAGNKNQRLLGKDLIDPDLEAKPAEWKHNTRYVAVNPADPFQVISR
jgi:carbon storage regulator CsrA